ncbi:hypothetical protein FKX85_05200 [Echinicola soli]|uniref:Lipoprotein n=1 Tax=Echinicola soli TaxID=2591634 RepID=A0A514CFC3_9BACT|nr:hypothetical protein [Echinicola soli]QDH78460.1 hypothetical protein FKX85_05200 [Echinicola soli]
MKIRLFILFFFTACLGACQHTSPPAVSFYYWKTALNLNPTETHTIKANEVKKLYVRYFDVALSADGLPYPVSEVTLDHFPDTLEIVPVVYIKNEVMLSSNLDVAELAKKISKHVNSISENNHLSYQEIQIDCDWSLKSRDHFMAFIDQLDEMTDKTLSATIRLHQIKYAQKTKVPNVDYGVLMYYNMGEINARTANSIYDKTIADLYTYTLGDYPLPLKVAMPIFSWGIHLRNGQVVGLRPKVTASALKMDAAFAALKPNFFEVKKDLLRNGTYYRKGDVLKTEAVSQGQLLEMAEDLGNHMKVDEIIFYDLDSMNLRNYEKDIFAQVRAAF